MVMGSGGTPEARALAAQSDLASSQKSPAMAYILCIFLGVFGAHRFYLRRTGSAIAMLLITVLTLGAGAVITFVWEIVDLFLINGMVRQANAEILTGVQQRHGLAVSNYPSPGGMYGAQGDQAPGGYAAPGDYAAPGNYAGPGGYAAPGSYGGPQSYAGPAGYAAPGGYGPPDGLAAPGSSGAAGSFPPRRPSLLPAATRQAATRTQALCPPRVGSPPRNRSRRPNRSRHRPRSLVHSRHRARSRLRTHSRSRIRSPLRSPSRAPKGNPATSNQLTQGRVADGRPGTRSRAPISGLWTAAGMAPG